MRYKELGSSRLGPALLVASVVVGLYEPNESAAGTFTGAGEGAIPLNLVLHPLFYDGTGGEIGITVCIESTSPDRFKLISPVMRAIETWDDFQATTGTFLQGGDTEVPQDHHDVESVVLHELGHCLGGLGHTNLGNKLTGVEFLFFKDASDSTKGPNGSFDFVFIGGDSAWGSRDDSRGDDENLVWFDKASNNPFATQSPIDASTYSQDLADLPVGDSYAANGTPDVATDLGLPKTKAVMYSVAFPEAEHRSLSANETATISLGMSGLDETEGTGDDYTIALFFVEPGPCDITVGFGPVPTTTTGICQVGASQIGSSNHFSLGLGTITLSTDPSISWFFGPSPDLDLTKSDGDISVSPGDPIAYELITSNIGDALASGVRIEETIPEGTTFLSSGSDPGWACSGTGPGSICDISLGDIPPQTTRPAVDFSVTVDDPSSVPEVTNIASVTALEFEQDASNNVAVEVTPVDLPCSIDEDLILDSLGEELVYEACNSITAGTAFTVGTGQNVVLRTRNILILTDGFSVELDGGFTGELDPVVGQ